jgi:hypothetical protein
MIVKSREEAVDWVLQEQKTKSRFLPL